MKVLTLLLVFFVMGLSGCLPGNIKEADSISHIPDAQTRIAQMEALNVRYPNDPNPYVYLSVDYLAAGQNDKVIALLDRALAKPELKNYTNEDFWELVKQDPSKFHYFKGLAYSNKGDQAQAIEEYDQAISILTGLLLKSSSVKPSGIAGDVSQMDFWRKIRKDTAAADLESYYSHRAFSEAAARNCEDALADFAKAKEHLLDRAEYLATKNENARNAPGYYTPIMMARVNKYPDRKAPDADLIRQLAVYHAFEEYQLAHGAGNEGMEMALPLELLLKCQSGAGR